MRPTRRILACRTCIRGHLNRGASTSSTTRRRETCSFSARAARGFSGMMKRSWCTSSSPASGTQCRDRPGLRKAAAPSEQTTVSASLSGWTARMRATERGRREQLLANALADLDDLWRVLPRSTIARRWDGRRVAVGIARARSGSFLTILYRGSSTYHVTCTCTSM